MFTKDTWITSIQFLPLDPSVVHHTGIAFVPHKGDVKYNEPIWERVQRDANLITIPGQKFVPTVVSLMGIGGGEQDTYVPGPTMSDYRRYNAARGISANNDGYLNLQYNPQRHPGRTPVKVGFTGAKKTPKRERLMGLG